MSPINKLITLNTLRFRRQYSATQMGRVTSHGVSLLSYTLSGPPRLDWRLGTPGRATSCTPDTHLRTTSQHIKNSTRGKSNSRAQERGTQGEVQTTRAHQQPDTGRIYWGDTRGARRAQGAGSHARKALTLCYGCRSSLENR